MRANLEAPRSTLYVDEDIVHLHWKQWIQVFDGDILNLVSLKIDQLKKEFDRNFNPKKSLIISRNDGYFNDNFNLLKDEIIGLYQFNNCD